MATGVGGAGGFNLHYDDSAPLRAVDVGGADQEQRIKDFVSGAIENLSHDITTQKAYKELGLESQEDLIPGMEVRLMPHQAIGVAWMLRREKHKDRGGILADDMGLGKTVQMIATMVMNMPSPVSEKRTTLVVVPAALLKQWKDEILDKTNDVFTVHIHHGLTKLKTPEAVRENDVVITTYQTLSQDFNVPDSVAEVDRAKWLQKEGGVLARTYFFRAIVDEAQFIRNRSTIAIAWLLTGTPITNTLADIYGLIRFGHFPPWNDWNSVQGSDAILAGERAKAILEPLIFRRTKNSTLEGKPILSLLDKHIRLVTLEFSKDEREIYECFEKSTQVKINRFIKAGTLMKNHAYILVLILRLRQLCCHPYLSLSSEDEGDDGKKMSNDAATELARAKRIMSQEWVESIKRRFLLKARVKEGLAKPVPGLLRDDCPVCQEVYSGDNGRVLPCGHEICMDCLVNLYTDELGHDGIFGEGTDKENMEKEKQYEDARKKNLRPCPTCKKMVNPRPPKIFKSFAFEPSDKDIRGHSVPRGKRRADSDSDDSDAEVKPSKNGDLKKAKPTYDDNFDSLLADSDDDDLMDLDSMMKQSQMRGEPKKKKMKLSESDCDDDLVPSAKMVEMLRLLREADAAGDKSIVYSQWTANLDLLEKLLSRHGMRSLRFDGTMNRQDRDDVLAKFKDPRSYKIILISTRAGSVGLNLVQANRVVNMDLSWNYAAESQAYDRCHRIGQIKEVYINRLVIKDTIEERMLQLQEVKVGPGRKLSKLSVKNIKFLFGMSRGKDSNNPEDDQD
ncbi:SNF2 family DNA-dependent ATPase [Flagelloscypha sp. PMI_526]|nr:SNF2 family DNA-dependent ATPase [Flagelloscypha sp. PMI_526]